jgi:hypothetical protein
MDRINIGDQFSFLVEQEERRLRLIVFNGDEELVCHKADRAKIQRFIMADKSHLFKGRLQLDKTGDHIRISVKGKTAGIISLSKFEKLVN